MLDEEQRSKVIELFGKGISISEIARRVGISRPSVYRVIETDVEKDAELLELKKKLRKTELETKIMELKAPMKRRNKLDKLEKLIDGVMSWVLILWDMHPDSPRVPGCLYCGGGERLKHYEKNVNGEPARWYKCDKCGRAYRTR